MPSDLPVLPIRLQPEQADRIRKTARERGLSQAAFVLESALAECTVAEERRSRKYRPPKEENATPGVADAPKSAGLGIAARIAPSKEESEEPTAAAPSPVTVNVNTGTNSDDAAQITKLAGYVVKGPSYLRDSRLRNAVDVLKSMTEDKDERAALGASLDAAIKKLEAKDGSTSLKTTAMNKLREFLR